MSKRSYWTEFCSQGSKELIHRIVDLRIKEMSSYTWSVFGASRELRSKVVRG